MAWQNLKEAVMNRKGLFGVIIAVLIFSVTALTIETSISFWQVVLGFIIFWILILSFANLRNSLMLLASTLVLLLIVYLSVKYHWVGIVPGAIVGATTGLLMHFGWIVPHKPFSRSEYIKTQQNSRPNRKEEL